MTLWTVVWGTGNLGRAAVRAVSAHPGLTLHAVLTSTAAKVGRDAGEVADVEPLGVALTDETAGGRGPLVGPRPSSSRGPSPRPPPPQRVLPHRTR